MNRNSDIRACCCIGKQNGEPFCPCKMRAKGIIKRDGKWVQPEVIVGEISEDNRSDAVKAFYDASKKMGWYL